MTISLYTLLCVPQFKRYVCNTDDYEAHAVRFISRGEYQEANTKRLKTIE